MSAWPGFISLISLISNGSLSVRCSRLHLAQADHAPSIAGQLRRPRRLVRSGQAGRRQGRPDQVRNPRRRCLGSIPPRSSRTCACYIARDTRRNVTGNRWSGGSSSALRSTDSGGRGRHVAATPACPPIPAQRRSRRRRSVAFPCRVSPSRSRSPQSLARSPYHRHSP
jgi:hypothetical protein